MLGFVNGLAIVIFLAQMTQFKVPKSANSVGSGTSGSEWLSGEPLYMMLALVILTMGIIWVMPRITKVLPAPLAGIGIVAAIVTVYSDLAVAVVVGVIVSALAYAWNNARRIHAKISEIQRMPKSITFRVLCFGSTDGFTELFDLNTDPDQVIIDFADSRVVDQSALQAIEAVAARYQAAGKQIQLVHLSRDCHALLSKAGHLMIDSDDDPDYGLAVNYSVRVGILGEGH